MTKDLIAYFKTEDNAESARAGLQRLRLENVYVDEMPEEDDATAYVPIITPDPEALSGSPANAFDAGNTGLVQGPEGESIVNPDVSQPVTHLLFGKVREDEYAEALEIIHKAQGYVKKE